MSSTRSDFNFSVCRFVSDPLRDEALNVGIIVVSDELKKSRGLFNLRFKARLSALGTKSEFEFVRRSIENLRARTGSGFQPSLGVSGDEAIRSTEDLRESAGRMRNQLQLTEPRPYRAVSLDQAANELYELYVSSIRKPDLTTDTPMSIHQLRKLIRETLQTWGVGHLKVQEKTLERAHRARHLADFWLEAGEPVAAFVAIPEDPGDRFEAWARRDSIPTIADAFLERNPFFKTVAVLPPNGHVPTEFVLETRDFLSERPGVLVLHADQLEDHKREILNSAL
jgi:hypothetical protein